MSDPEPSASDEADVTRTVTLTDKDVRDAARLFRLISDGTPWATLVLSESEVRRRPSAEPSPRDELLSRAKTVLHARRLRARHFSPGMFAEPAWDILLFLYLCDFSIGRQTIGRLADFVEIPLTTVLRWVTYLEKEHLVARKNHPTDRRVIFVELTEKGLHSMEAFLAEMPG